ncbi:MAG TPA: tripartite tricarboxylate transporter substrate-binding protein [Candidatus Binatia bacterium]|jgi:tripartite-type tricarboxylate transporter receptor subunit TctC|nr:tripartite tricarboxylate transporter substrate-binding protein [Candidatus Binatia bacterium]
MKRFAFALLFLLASIPSLQAQAPFYQGKTIRIVVGNISGDAYDLWARIFAQHMGKYIPGNPTFIVQNMPGAGGVIAANYVYSVAKPDGLTMGTFGPSMYFDQLSGRKEVQFDWSKFTWIGTPEQTEFILIMRTDNPYQSIEEIRKAAQPPKCGATGTSTSGYYIPKFLDEGMGIRFNIVSGYPGGGEIDLGIERGELHCRNLTISTYFAREPFLTWHKKGFVRPIMQTTKKRDARVADVPSIYELMDQYKTPEATRRVATVLLAPAVFGRPMVATPGVPPDRVKILRDAYHTSLKDPALLEELKKRRWEVDAISGEEMANLAKEVISQPPEVIERMKKLLGN